jgi:hypothetical protein
MTYELTSFRPRSSETHAVNNIVETTLEKAQQVLTGRALQLCRFLVIVAELAFQHTIHATEFLLFAKLQAIVRQARAALWSTARRHLELALRLERTNTALQKQIRAFAAGQFTFWS